MAHAQLLYAVRLLVAQAFSQLGGGEAPVMHEALMIRGGAYCGRRFDAFGLHAVWLAEENEIVFYEADGNELQVIEVPEQQPAQFRVAA